MPDTFTFTPEPLIVPFGQLDQNSIYVYDNSSAEWKSIEYLSFNVKCRRNEVRSFYVDAFGIEDAEKLYIKEQAQIMIFAENYLVLKGRIQTIKYEDSYLCHIEGNGIEVVGMDSNFIKSSDPRITYASTSAQTIAKEILSKNSDGLSPWVTDGVNSLEPYTTGLFDTDFGEIGIRFEYLNKINCIIGLCDIIDYDWKIINTNQDTYTKNYVSITPTEYTGVSIKTFRIGTTNENATTISNEKDVNQIITKITVLGHSDGASQTMTDFYAASVDYSFISTEIDDDDTSLTLEDGSTFPSEGILKIGREYVPYTRSSNTFTITRDYNSKIHRKYVMVFNWYDGTSGVKSTINDADGFITNDEATIKLTDASSFDSSGTIIIGSEIITYSGKSSNELTGCTRAKYNSIATRHNNGMTVYKYDGTKLFTAGEIYDSSNPTHAYPETSSNIDTYGLIEDTLEDRSIAREDAAELLASNKLYSLMTPVQRIEINTSDPIEDIQEVTVGNWIEIIDDESSINSTFKIVGFEYGEDQGQEYLKFECANGGYSLPEQLSNTAKKSEFEAKYMKGSTVLMPLGPMAENCNATNPLNVKFYLPPDVISIIDSNIYFAVEDYRGYAATTENTNQTSLITSSAKSFDPLSINYDSNWSSVTTTYTVSSDTESVLINLRIVRSEDNEDFQIKYRVYDGTSYYPSTSGLYLTGTQTFTDVIEPSDVADLFVVADSGALIGDITSGELSGDNYHTHVPSDADYEYFLVWDNSKPVGLDYGAIDKILIGHASILIPGNLNGKTLTIQFTNTGTGFHTCNSWATFIEYSPHNHNMDFDITAGSGSDATITLKAGDSGSEKTLSYSGTSANVKDYIVASEGMKNIQLTPDKACRITATGYIKAFVEAK